MKKFLFTLALLVSATTATAGMTDAEKVKATCLGWQLDRAVLALMIEKQHDLRVALSDVGGTEQKQLANQLIQNISALIDAAEKTYAASGEAYSTACER